MRSAKLSRIRPPSDRRPHPPLEASHRRPVELGMVSLLAASLAACEPAAGEEGTTLALSLAGMSGGVVFSSGGIPGSNNYDLWWVQNSGVPRVEVPIQLTTTDTPDAQPSVSANGQAIVFVRQGEGIFLIDAGGTVHRITDTGGRNFSDSMPALSADADRVAWVRTWLDRPLRDGFATSEIWTSAIDGSGAAPVVPKPDVVQDTPVFEPRSGSTRLAWSEFNGRTLTANGPVDYGIWLHDLNQFAGRFLCQGEVVVDNFLYRCFGQHLVWPEPNLMVLTQQMLVLDPVVGQFGGFLPTFVEGLSSADFALERNQSQAFFTPFPISGHFGRGLMVADGIIRPFSGDDPTWAMFVAEGFGNRPRRLEVQGLVGDIDVVGTAGYLFSLSRPQLIP